MPIPRDPLKRRARNAVRYALRIGKIKKQACVTCGCKKSEAHHPDYSKPLSVVWLCKDHHRLVHRMEKKKSTTAVPKNVVINLCKQVEELCLSGVPFPRAMTAVVGQQVASGQKTIPYY